MLKQNGYSECERLWDEYEAATRNAFLLESKVKIANLERDSATVFRLQPDVHSTVERRRTLRKQIVAHGAESHGQTN
jgi:hypothetical protein